MLSKKSYLFQKRGYSTFAGVSRWWSHCFTMKKTNTVLIHYKKILKTHSQNIIFTKDQFRSKLSNSGSKMLPRKKKLSISPDIISFCHAVTIGWNYIPQTSDDEILKSEEWILWQHFSCFDNIYFKRTTEAGFSLFELEICLRSIKKIQNLIPKGNNNNLFETSLRKNTASRFNTL